MTRRQAIMMQRQGMVRGHRRRNLPTHANFDNIRSGMGVGTMMVRGGMRVLAFLAAMAFMYTIADKLHFAV